MTNILVTGSSGFVGSRLVEKLIENVEFQVRALVRGTPPQMHERVCYHRLADFDQIDAEHESLTDVHVVIHLASRVHVMNDTEVDPLAAFRAVNVGHTLNLARSAAIAGAKRFIFVSSVKVNGECTIPDRPFRETDIPKPVDFYGISKLEAEEGLRLVAAETGMEVVIIRPVLIYGPGVKANFKSMMKFVRMGIPLPFGAIRNQRSLVALDNLVDLLTTCLNHPAAANQTFLVSDGEDVSTTQLLVKLADALNRPSRLVPVPAWLLAAGAALLGKNALSQRLCGSLQVDITKARIQLGWHPVLTLDQALSLTAEHFISEQS
ncbi:UDP-glucose 4-epimerase family protein [Pseudomonas sp. Ant30-3]|uniref:UDP-glucose 4-epimerase family protein n=1 Tax=Pseudomonas sp. Ant30-3 TaxID=1488328 RepID=UPI00048AEA90|nr:SDR family oxidoreductase [Pseudomonas sp. Ant30-3]